MTTQTKQTLCSATFTHATNTSEHLCMGPVPDPGNMAVMGRVSPCSHGASPPAEETDRRTTNFIKESSVTL